MSGGEEVLNKIKKLRAEKARIEKEIKELGAAGLAELLQMQVNDAVREGLVRLPNFNLNPRYVRYILEESFIERRI